MKKIKTIINKLLGRCDHCGRYFKYPKRRRMSTAYVEEEANYCVECKECFIETQEYWADMWRDYYSGRL